MPIGRVQRRHGMKGSVGRGVLYACVGRDGPNCERNSGISVVWSLSRCTDILFLVYIGVRVWLTGMVEKSNCKKRVERMKSGVKLMKKEGAPALASRASVPRCGVRCGPVWVLCHGPALSSWGCVKTIHSRSANCACGRRRKEAL